MDFELSDDQIVLREAANQILSEQSSAARVRAVVDNGGGWDRELWASLMEQGWSGIATSELLGGVGLGWVEAAVLVEALGVYLAPVPLLGQLLVLDVLSCGSLTDASLVVGSITETHRSDLIGGLVSGDMIAAAGFGCLAAKQDSSGWILSGQTEPIPFASSADVVVVRATDGDGQERLFLIEQDAQSRPAAESAMDQTRELARLSLDGTRATELGGPELVGRYIARGAIAYSAELLGAASRCLDLTVEHAKERVQFGRPIGSFQAVKHRCADMLVDLEGMRSSTWWAAWCAEVADPETALAASVAKSWCSDAADRVLKSALQIHGGMGFTWECDVHLYLKRVQLDRVSFGSAAWHRDRVAEILRARVQSGAGVL